MSFIKNIVLKMKRVLIFSVLVLSFIASPLVITQLFSQPILSTTRTFIRWVRISFGFIRWIFSSKKEFEKINSIINRSTFKRLSNLIR
jgi:hypothetical protein